MSSRLRPVGSRVLGCVDAHAREEAPEVVEAAGEQRHLRHVAFLAGSLGRRAWPVPDDGSCVVSQLLTLGTRDHAPPLADLEHEGDVVPGGDALQRERAVGPGEREGDEVADRRVARAAGAGARRDRREVRDSFGTKTTTFWSGFLPAGS